MYPHISVVAQRYDTEVISTLIDHTRAEEDPLRQYDLFPPSFDNSIKSSSSSDGGCLRAAVRPKVALQRWPAPPAYEDLPMRTCLGKQQNRLLPTLGK